MFLGFHPLSPGHACNWDHLHSMASQLHSSSLGTGPYKWPRSQYHSSCCQWIPYLGVDSQVHIWQHLLLWHNSVLSPAPIRIITGFTWRQSIPAMDMQETKQARLQKFWLFWCIKPCPPALVAAMLLGILEIMQIMFKIFLCSYCFWWLVHKIVDSGTWDVYECLILRNSIFSLRKMGLNLTRAIR